MEYERRIFYVYTILLLQSPSLSTENEGNAGQSVDVRCSVVDVAEDYTKRKHVLRVANPTAEVLLQTEDAASMALWLRSLHSHAAAERSSVSANYGIIFCQMKVPLPSPLFFHYFCNH